MSSPDRRIELVTALTGAPSAELRALLDGTVVTISVDPQDGTAAVLAAAAVASLSARVVGHVHVPPLDMSRPNPWGARTLPGVVGASRIAHPAARPLLRDTSNGSTRRRISIAIGGTARGGAPPARPAATAAWPRITATGVGAAPGNGSRRGRSTGTGTDRGPGGVGDPGTCIWFGGDDWTAVVSRDGPVDVGHCPLGGLGLQAAAALAFGEVLKELLGPMGMRSVPIEGALVWNLLDGRLGPAPVPAVSGPVSPPLVAFLGAGSVGSSAAALLSLTPVVGLADAVDPDRFLPLRNAYRCPGVAAGESCPKVDWVARILRQAGWGVRPHRGHLVEWAATRAEPGYDGIALVSVDNVEARRDAAELQAATTLTAGVSGAALHVHRHLAGDELACPYCELVDANHWREQAETYARITGLTAVRVLELMGGATLTADDVATAVWTGCIPPGAVGELTREGARLADLVAHHYATVAVRGRGERPTGTSGRSAIAAPADAVGSTAAQVVSAPHVSWLAGTLLAAEVVKAAIGLPGLDRRVDLDLSGVPLGGWRRPARDTSGRCLCANPVRRHLARALYDTR